MFHVTIFAENAYAALDNHPHVAYMWVIGMEEAMTVTISKCGKGQFQAIAPDELGPKQFKIFRDFYTGLWRIRTEGGTIDWSRPFRTAKEAKEYLRSRFE